MRRLSRSMPRSGVLALALVAAAAALPPASSAGPGVSQLNAAIGSQKARVQTLAVGVGSLGQTIGRLDGQVSLIAARRAAVEATLGQDQASLAGVRAQQGTERRRLALLVARLARARLVLERELVAEYENDPPDVISVVLTAHGFADLIDKLEYVRAAKEHQQGEITATRVAKARASAAAAALASLASRDQTITAAAARQARAVAAISQLLDGRRAALSDARAAQLLALHAAQSRTGQLQRALRKLQAQLAASAGRAYGHWAIPQAIVTCESGGQNLSPNSAGASGYYQFLPSTWAGLGGSTPAAYLAPKSEQDRLAATLWNGGRGASNWVCAGVVGIG